MQGKRRERGSTGVVGSLPGAPEYVTSDPCWSMELVHFQEVLSERGEEDQIHTYIDII